jgi:mycofactocin precursor
VADNAVLVAEQDEQDEQAPAEADASLTEELLVEEISIDGMCGVY